jgi:hypothetical protein
VCRYPCISLTACPASSSLPLPAPFSGDELDNGFFDGCDECRACFRRAANRFVAVDRFQPTNSRFRYSRSFGDRVPELTPDVDIKPNKRVSLRRIVVALSCSHRSLSLEVIYE